MAVRHERVSRLSLAEISVAFYRIKKQVQFDVCIIGSGLENYPETLAFLERETVVLGTATTTFYQIQNSIEFYSNLSELKINFPEISLTQPDDIDSWLVKPVFGQGGSGIHFADQQLPYRSDDIYWQRYINNQAMSVLFLADQSMCKIIGFQKQLTQSGSFVFKGVIRAGAVNLTVVKQIERILEQLIPRFSLIGLHSLDFMLKNEQVYVLEINPRITASMQLYEHRILLEHINCCFGGQLPDIELIAIADGFEVLFAENSLKIKKGIDWPDWIFDRPVAGTIINTGEPICSMIAHGESEEIVLKQLETRRKAIIELLL